MRMHGVSCFAAEALMIYFRTPSMVNTVRKSIEHPQKWARFKNLHLNKLLTIGKIFVTIKSFRTFSQTPLNFGPQAAEI